MNLLERDPDAFGDVSAESVLSIADEPVDVLRQRIQLALRYTFSWMDAAGDASDRDGVPFSKRISDVQTALFVLLDLIPAGSVFIGKDAKAAYERVSRGYAELYRDVVFSADTLPQPSLIEVLGDLGTAAFKAPVAAAKTAAQMIADSIRQLLGNTAAALWTNLWPWLLLAGGAGLVYLFRAPLARALGKVAS